MKQIQHGAQFGLYLRSAPSMDLSGLTTCVHSAERRECVGDQLLSSSLEVRQNMLETFLFNDNRV